MTAEGEKAFASELTYQISKTSNQPKDAINYEALIGRVIDAVQRSSVRLLRRFTGLSPAVVQQLQRRQMSDWQHRIHVLVCPSLGTLGNCLSVANLNRLVHLLGESRTRYLMLTAEFLEVESLTTSGL